MARDKSINSASATKLQIKLNSIPKSNKEKTTEKFLDIYYK